MAKITTKRTLKGTLIQGTTHLEVRGAAASAFASFARRNAPPELTKVTLGFRSIIGSL